MSARALQIVKEEIARAKENTPRVRHPLLEALEETIVERIETELLELGNDDPFFEPDTDAEKDESNSLHDAESHGHANATYDADGHRFCGNDAEPNHKEEN